MTNTNTLTDLMYAMVAQGLMVLRQYCVMPSLVNRTLETRAGEQFSSIDIHVPSEITANAVTPGPTPPDNTGVTPTKKTITCDQWFDASFFLNDREIQEVGMNIVPMQLGSAAKALANKINADIFATYKKFYGYAGTAGTTPFGTSLAEFIDARKVLNRQLAPTDDRRVVLGVDAEAAALGLRQIQDASFRAAAANSLVSGKIGTILGSEWYTDQAVPTHTAGTITTGLIAKAATVVAAGLKTFLATTAASTGACALLVGDIISIAGHTTTYTLTAVATQAVAASDVALVFEPGLEIALAGSEAVTVKGSHVVNLAFQRDAIAFVTRPFAGSNVTGNRRFVFLPDPVSGLVLRLEITDQHKRTNWAFDVLYGVQVIRPELGCRLAG